MNENAGYDAALAAIADGQPYVLACPNGHQSLPPREVCPDCGASTLERTSLSTTGEVLTYNVTHVPTPEFEADAPFVLGIASFDAIRLTGRVQAPAEAVSVGMAVELAVEPTETTGQQTIVFRPTQG